MRKRTNCHPSEVNIIILSILTNRSLEGPTPCEQGSKGPMGNYVWRCISTGQDGSNEVDFEWIGRAIAGLRRPQSFIRTNGRTETIPKSPFSPLERAGNNKFSSIFMFLRLWSRYLISVYVSECDDLLYLNDLDIAKYATIKFPYTGLGKRVWYFQDINIYNTATTK